MTTVALFVMLVIAAAIVVLTGPIANQVGTPSAAHNKTYGALATVIVRERPPTHAVRHGRRSRRAVSHYRFRRQTSGKGRAPQRLETRMIMNDTTGKPLAVVTGASSGIGGELAARFAEHGYDLVVAAEDERIESTAASLAGQAVQALPVQADLAAFDGVEELWQRIQGTGRVPEAVAINAGVGVAGDFTRDNDLADELRLIGLNITGAVHLARRVLPEMVAAGRGGVLFTSSIAATAPGPYHATYAASKAFLLSFAEALRYELRDTGVTVTALLPGPTDTEFFDRAGMQGTKLREETAKDDPAEVAREGFEALMAGKDHIVAGSMKNKAQMAAGRIMPETAKAATQARQTAPGSGI